MSMPRNFFVAATAAKSRSRFYFVQRLLQQKRCETFISGYVILRSDPRNLCCNGAMKGNSPENVGKASVSTRPPLTCSSSSSAPLILPTSYTRHTLSSVLAWFYGQRHTSILKKKFCKNREFSYDVTAAILVFQNYETAAMLVYQTNPVGVEVFSYFNTLFYSNKFAWLKD